MATDEQIRANKRNGEKSTGPTSEAGKARVALNAVKTGLTARIMLLSVDDAPIYQKHVERFVAKYSAATEDEQDVVQTIADTEWRLRHIAPLEAGIYATGRTKCAHLVADIQDPVQREGALIAEIYLEYKKDLTNIALQERRLSNQLDKAVAKLEALQRDRHAARQKELSQADKSIKACEANNLEPDFKSFGFDFSVEEFQTFLIRCKNYHTLTGGKILNFDKFLTEFRAESETEAAA